MTKSPPILRLALLAALLAFGVTLGVLLLVRSSGSPSAAERSTPSAAASTSRAAAPAAAPHATPPKAPSGRTAGKHDAAVATLAATFPEAKPAISAAEVAHRTVLTVAAPSRALVQPGSGKPGFGATRRVVGDRAWSCTRHACPTPHDVYAAMNAAWRAEMAVAYTASVDPTLLHSRLVFHGTKLSRYTRELIDGSLHDLPSAMIGAHGATLIGHVGRGLARRQLNSNLRAVRSALGRRLLATSTTVIPVSRSTFGIEADLRVTSIRAIAAHIGDVLLGLRTGLIFGANTAIEGLAVNVVDARGARVSEWLNGRQGGADIESTTPVHLEQHRPDIAFPDLTGGPPLETSTRTSGATTLPPGREIHIVPTR